MKSLLKYLGKNKQAYMGANIGVDPYNEGFNHAMDLIKKYKIQNEKNSSNNRN